MLANLYQILMPWQVRKALNTIASMILAENKDARAMRKGDKTPRFIQSHLLGLMARLTEVINDPNLPFQERRRYIRAMEQMLCVIKDSARFARPQVRKSELHGSFIAHMCTRLQPVYYLHWRRTP